MCLGTYMLTPRLQRVLDNSLLFVSALPVLSACWRASTAAGIHAPSAKRPPATRPISKPSAVVRAECAQPQPAAGLGVRLPTAELCSNKQE